jgi:2-polyprenyl-3-methyl-5-hydroxy-6-metoxy-1,4-benzoquinol methylase
LCTNVLEHIYDIKSAIKNLNFLLKEEGHLLVSVPLIYPLHDEPEDFWRFTEHALKNLFSDFKILKIKRTGIRQFPTQYIFPIVFLSMLSTIYQKMKSMKKF